MAQAEYTKMSVKDSNGNISMLPGVKYTNDNGTTFYFFFNKEKDAGDAVKALNNLSNYFGSDVVTAIKLDDTHLKPLDRKKFQSFELFLKCLEIGQVVTGMYYSKKDEPTKIPLA
ncbi:MAG: hypothetical protein QXY61_00995 [Candidatus Anstonellales archaeon]